MNKKQLLLTAVREETKTALKNLKKDTGYSYGEIIDRVIINSMPKDAKTAAILALDDMLSHCRKLSNEQFYDACGFILDMMKKGFDGKAPENVNEKLKYLEELIRQQKISL